MRNLRGGFVIVMWIPQILLLYIAIPNLSLIYKYRENAKASLLFLMAEESRGFLSIELLAYTAPHRQSPTLRLRATLCPQTCLWHHLNEGREKEEDTNSFFPRSVRWRHIRINFYQNQAKVVGSGAWVCHSREHGSKTPNGSIDLDESSRRPLGRSTNLRFVES